MEKEIKEMIADILDSLNSYREINEDTKKMMKYPENIKFFEGRSDGILEAMAIIKTKLATLTF